MHFYAARTSRSTNSFRSNEKCVLITHYHPVNERNQGMCIDNGLSRHPMLDSVNLGHMCWTALVACDVECVGKTV